MNQEALLNVLLLVPTFLFALSFHEFAHAWVAFRRGDATAYEMGRLTLHPLAHADLMGTFLLPILCIYNGWPFIGWAKPVPIDYHRLKNGRWDTALVAGAGPASNILLALLATALLAILVRIPLDHRILESVQLFTVLAIQVNLMLAFFNLIPVPPLDGFMVAQAFLPRSATRLLYALSTPLKWVLILMLLFGGFRYLLIPTMYIYKSLILLATRN